MIQSDYKNKYLEDNKFKLENNSKFLHEILWFDSCTSRFQYGNINSFNQLGYTNII